MHSISAAIVTSFLLFGEHASNASPPNESNENLPMAVAGHVASSCLALTADRLSFRWLDTVIATTIMSAHKQAPSKPTIEIFWDHFKEGALFDVAARNIVRTTSRSCNNFRRLS